MYEKVRLNLASRVQVSRSNPLKGGKVHPLLERKAELDERDDSGPKGLEGKESILHDFR
jgi:hypothetical protein